MKKFLLGLALSLLLPCSLALAALDASTLWEVHPTNGNDTFGGAWYDAGGSSTDYTNQDTAQLSLTDCATSGIGVTTLTSATGGFTAAMVGNCINLSAGTNLLEDFYQITVYTDTNTVTLDSAPDDGVGGVSAATGKVGGALATVNKADGAVVAGNTVWIKNEAWNEAVDLTTSGGISTPIVYEGYNTSRADEPRDGNMPKNARAGAGAIGWDSNAVEHIVVKHLWIDNAGSDCFYHEGAKVVYKGCRATNATTDGFGGTSGDDTDYFLVDCEAALNGANGTDYGGQYQSVNAWGCYFHDNGAVGCATGSNSGMVAQFCISEANASHGFYCFEEYSHWLFNNISDGNTGVNTDGINGGSSSRIFIMNNLLTNNGDDGYASRSTTTGHFIDYNCFFGNGGVATSGVTDLGANNITSDPKYNDRAGHNFGIASDSPCKATAMPGIFQNLTTTTGYLDMGAVQRQEAGGNNATQAVMAIY